MGPPMPDAVIVSLLLLVAFAIAFTLAEWAAARSADAQRQRYADPRPNHEPRKK